MDTWSCLVYSTLKIQHYHCCGMGLINALGISTYHLRDIPSPQKNLVKSFYIYIYIYAFIFLRHVPRRRIAELQGNSLMNFLKNCKIVFECGYIFFLLPSAIREGFHVLTYICFCSFFFLTVAVLVGRKRYLIVVFTCFSQ